MSILKKYQQQIKDRQYQHKVKNIEKEWANNAKSIRRLKSEQGFAAMNKYWEDKVGAISARMEDCNIDAEKLFRLNLEKNIIMQYLAFIAECIEYEDK